MLRSRLAMAAMAAASIGTIAMAPPPRVVVQDDNPSAPTPEKMSRQRKRWLERQARKQMRAHKKTRR